MTAIIFALLVAWVWLVLRGSWEAYTPPPRRRPYRRRRRRSGIWW